MKKVVMFGQFAPPVTGEAMVNDKVYNLLKQNDLEVSVVNSSIIRDANSVGKFSFYKIKRLVGVYTEFRKSLNKASLVYLTPGQTILGILRLLPILAYCRYRKVIVIAHWHGYGLLWLLPLHSKLLSYVGSKIDMNVFLTEHLKSSIDKISNGFKNSVVITNYVKTPETQSIQIKRGKRLKVLYLGSLMEQKGIKTLLTAAQSLPQIDFFICGKGSEEIENKVLKFANNNTHITYCGLVSGDQKNSLLRDSDVFVLQTNYSTEGVPLSILEAMAHKCAIVTTEHNGIPETVADCAFFIEKESSEALANKLEILDKDSGMLMLYKEKAFKRSKDFSESKFDENLLSLIENIN